MSITREQIIDIAVKRSMKRSTMQSVLNHDWAARHIWKDDNGGPFKSYPRRLGAIYYNFRRLKSGLKPVKI